MKKNQLPLMLLLLVVVAGGGWLAVAAGPGAQARAREARTAQPAPKCTIADSAISHARIELLEIAFASASAMPAQPHLKTRSELQEKVVSACLALDQPARALEYLEQILNWRRGTAYADLACWCAEHGDPDQVRAYLDHARQVYESPQGEAVQDWQRDRIRARIARALALLGHLREAREFESGLNDSELGHVAAARATLGHPGVFEEQAKVLDAAVAAGNFDLIRGALEACAQAYEHDYADAERRVQIEEKIKASWKRIPQTVRLDIQMELVEAALSHGDFAQALELVNEAQVVLEHAALTAEVVVPLKAKLAALRYRAGDTQFARRDVNAALELFQLEREKIVNMYRADALIPLAEAYRTIAETGDARSIYAKAVDELLENPNSRPRDEDLCVVCCSLATHDVEPDEQLWSKLRKIRAGLGAPW